MSFKCCTSRQGVPSKMVSDNGNTFNLASNVIWIVVSNPVVERHFADLQVKWKFNLERAPWWRGIFERLIRCTKCCLKKTIRRASLIFNELSTLVVGNEAVLNSRPLTCIDTDDLEEPLTPSHLLLRYRVISLPDPSTYLRPRRPKLWKDLNGSQQWGTYLIKMSEQFRKTMENRVPPRIVSVSSSPQAQQGYSYPSQGGSNCHCVRGWYPQRSMETQKDRTCQCRPWWKISNAEVCSSSKTSLYGRWRWCSLMVAALPTATLFADQDSDCCHW